MKINVFFVNDSTRYFEIVENSEVLAAGFCGEKSCTAFHGENCRHEVALEVNFWGAQNNRLEKLSDQSVNVRKFINSTLTMARRNKAKKLEWSEKYRYC